MSRLILREANLVDGDHPARRATIVVAGERIEAVGENAPEVRPDDRVVDLGGRTVMPGMVQGHFHAGYWKTGSLGGPLGLESPPPLTVMRAVANFKTALECGYTGVISAGAPFALDAAMKMAIAEGVVVGPRIMAGSCDVGTTGHSTDMSFRSWWNIGAKGAVNRCDGPEDVRRAVREEIKDGAEIIKIFLTGGHATPGTGADWAMSREELEMAVRTASERNVKTRGHMAGREAVLLSLDLGMHIIDHGDGFDDECIDRILEKGAYLTPSLFFPQQMMKDFPGSPFTDPLKPEFDIMAEILPKANAAGVKLLIGDDYGAITLDHGRYGEELALYVNEIGIPALDVIRWATKYGAEAMGLGKQTGTIEPGKLADLLVVDGDPVADITVLQDRTKLLAILKGGQLYKDHLATIPVERLSSYIS